MMRHLPWVLRVIITMGLAIRAFWVSLTVQPGDSDPKMQDFPFLLVPSFVEQPAAKSNNETEGGQGLPLRVNGSLPKDNPENEASSASDTMTLSASLQKEKEKSSLPSFDLISIGSLKLPHLQEAQARTFGSHKAVRNFLPFTELNDTEPLCHSDLTMGHIQQIVKFCQNRRHPWPPTLDKLRPDYANLKWLQKKKEPIGWMCAQKRPIDALYQYLQQYKPDNKAKVQHEEETDTPDSNAAISSPRTLPDYVVLMDDDTWLGMDQILQYAPQHYNPQEAHLVAGCMVRKRVFQHNFTFAYGGYGTFITQQALSKLIRPIYCQQYTSSENTLQIDPLQETNFEKQVCWRLQRDEVGEKHFFRDGMSVVDLMHAYTFDKAYLDVFQWHQRKDVGFCMHSDWAMGYFLNFYFIPQKVHYPRPGTFGYNDVPEDRMEGYKDSMFYTGKPNDFNLQIRRECMNSIDFQLKRVVHQHTNGDPFCDSKASVCHRISPQHMYSLYNQSRASIGT